MTMIAYANMSDFLNSGRAKVRRNELNADEMRKARTQTEEMLCTGDWSDATGRHHVALFMLLHEKVYGATAAEMNGRACYASAAQAARLQAENFDDDPAALATFVLWTWKREHERETWRRKNGKSGGRISARLQFGTFMLGDYAVDMKRAAEGRK
jgi:hypothetical protein